MQKNILSEQQKFVPTNAKYLLPSLKEQLQNIGILRLTLSAFLVKAGTVPFLFFKYFRFFGKLNTGNVLSAGIDFFDINSN